MIIGLPKMVLGASGIGFEVPQRNAGVSRMIPETRRMVLETPGMNFQTPANLRSIHVSSVAKNFYN
jgi:hypothetical protein